MEEAAQAVGPRPEEAIVIGDALTTDIAAARAVGARSILMLTGVTSREDVEALPDAERPTALAADAGELATILEALATTRAAT